MTCGSEGRWSAYYMRRGEQFQSFWMDFLASAERNLLFVLGQGFDPRMCLPLESVISAGGLGRRDCVLLSFGEGPESASLKYVEFSQRNLKRVSLAIEGRQGKIEHRVAPTNAARVFTSLTEFVDYSDVIVDVSAMPRNIYFPLIHSLLRLFITAHSYVQKPNLHVLVAENADLDGRICDHGIEEGASYIPSFGAIDWEATANKPKVWIPVLGESQEAQMRVIWDFVKPAELSPLLPFPSRNLRRGDDLLGEYRRFLFEELDLDPRNIIYADEQNPFQVYRQIRRAVVEYNRSLAILGGCRAVISALSSKLLSVGALLAAYELKFQSYHVGVAHVAASGYQVTGDMEHLYANTNSELFDLWLSGECYE